MISRLRPFLDPYIGLMILTVAVAAIVPARGIGAELAGLAADAGIVFLFFLYGARISRQAAISGVAHWRLQFAVLLCTYALFPVLGVTMAAVLPAGFPLPLLTGLLFLCLLPSTVQSSIAFTSIARGNVPAALCAASVSNILGVFITPLLAAWLLHAGGVSLSFGVFRDIVFQLLAPFLAGQLVRPWIGTWIRKHNRVLGYADRGSILLIIFVAFSKSVVDNIWSLLDGRDLVVLLALLAILLMLVLIITAFIGRRLMRLDVEDEIVLTFCGSKKSLASGVPMATVLFTGPQLGLIVLPLILFHQIQLIVCAILARHYARRQTPVMNQEAG